MPNHVGEFEQVVLLAILQCGDDAYAPTIRRVLEQRAGRSVSRGALYRTFDRLADKGYLLWELEDGGPVPERGGAPRGVFVPRPKGSGYSRSPGPPCSTSGKASRRSWRRHE